MRPSLKFDFVGFQDPKDSSKLEVWWRARGLPYDVLIRAGKRPDGRLRCTQLRVVPIDRDELTTREVQRIPLGLVMDSLAVWAVHMRQDDVGMSPVMRTAIEELWRDLPARAPAPRRSSITPKLLLRLAVAYRQLVDAGDRAPAKTLAQRPNLWKASGGHSLANVKRLLRIARKAGHLGPSKRGKAGERPKRRRK